MAAPVEPSRPWDAHLPPPWEDLAGWVEDELAPFPDGDDDPGWHHLADDLDGYLDDEASDDGSGEGSGSWVVPGLPAAGDVGGDGDGQAGAGGLSRVVVAALTETAASWRALRRAQARCYRALTALEDCDAVGETGYRATSRLLTEHVRLDPAEALRLARHARALSASVSPTGAPVPAPLPATATQVSAGVIGPGHVEVIRTTMGRLSALPALDPQLLATTEEQLAALASTRSPAALAEAAAAVLALLDPDGAAPDDQPPPDNELHYLRRRSGALVGRFIYRDPAAAEALHTALTVATPPPDPTPDPVPGEPRGESFGIQAARTLPERRAHALLDLAGEALTRGLNTNHPTDPTADPTDHDPTDHDPTDHGSADDPTADDAEQNEDDGDEDGGHDGGHDGGDGGHDSGPGPGHTPGWSRAELEGGERVALTVTLNYDTLRRALAAQPATGPTPGLSPGLLAAAADVQGQVHDAVRVVLGSDLEPVPPVVRWVGGRQGPAFLGLGAGQPDHHLIFDAVAGAAGQLDVWAEPLTRWGVRDRAQGVLVLHDGDRLEGAGKQVGHHCVPSLVDRGRAWFRVGLRGRCHRRSSSRSALAGVRGALACSRSRRSADPGSKKRCRVARPGAASRPVPGSPIGTTTLRAGGSTGRRSSHLRSPGRPTPVMNLETQGNKPRIFDEDAGANCATTSGSNGAPVSTTPQAPGASSSDETSRAATGPRGVPQQQGTGPFIPQQQGAGNVPPWTPQPPQGTAPRPTNSAATTGFIIALIAAVVACIPLLGTISWILAPIGIVFAVVGLSRATPSHAAVGRSMAIWGIVLGVIALIICSIYVSAITRAAHTTTSSSGNSYSAPYTYTAPAPSYSPPSYSSGSSSGSYSSSSGGSLSAPTVDPNTFSEGTYEVGTEIKPGTYKTTGSSHCYWERAKDASGEFSSIISNGNANGPGIVTVKSSDGYVKFDGTCTWTKK